VQLPPLFRERPRAVQLILAVVLPIAFGGACGFVLGESQTWFGIMTLIAGVGGIAAGFEHGTAREGALRGLVGGVLFAGSLLAVFEMRGMPALTPLPAAMSIMAVIYAVSGVPLGMLGGWLRSRYERDAARVRR
jgi:hypothetical protein